MDVIGKKILYISYDGMTDPLGQSQVIPYLLGLAKEGYQFTILSFEKKEKYKELNHTIKVILKSAGIKWVPMSFTSRPPLLSKFYDAVRMRSKAFSLQRKYQFDMAHCRSYLAADIGLLLKKKFGIKFFFDMRGFWADEKKDGGAWRLNHPVFRQVYKYYKKKEAAYLQNADHIISLTVAGKNELMGWPSYLSSVPVSVIPCCADMNHFSVTDSEQKRESRKILGLAQNGLVLSYLGSVGAWYMLDEMLEFFSLVKKEYITAIFLIITHSDPVMILSKLEDYNLYEQDVKIVKANRNQVPVYTKASDITVSFIKPVYSKISSSPTKIGEVLVMGIPVIANAGVGDMEAIITRTHAGIIITKFEAEEYKKAIQAISMLLKKSPVDIRSMAEDIYSLNKGVAAYKRCYEEVFTS
jgi:hypothetical protein